MTDNSHMDDIKDYLKDEDFLHKTINFISIVVGHMNKQKIDNFIVQGTLLGYKKYRSIMPWEADVDINIIAARADVDNNDLKEFINKNNLEYEWKYNDTMLKLRYKGVLYPCCDVCLMKKNGDQYCRDNYCNEKPPPRWFIDNVSKDYIYPLKQVKMNGVAVCIPNKTDEILDVVYPGYQNQIRLDPCGPMQRKKILLTKNMTAFHYLTGIAIGVSQYYLLKS